MQASPLSDCTNAAIQAINIRANSTQGSGCKVVATVRHNPYACCLLAPEDSVSSPMSNFSSPLNWAREVSPHDSFYAAYGHVPEEDSCVVSRSLFHQSSTARPSVAHNGCVNSADTSITADVSSHNTSCVQASSSTATPMKNIGKVYVGGRPVPVIRPRRAEVTVELRSGEAQFVVDDVYAVFPSSVTEPKDLVGQYVIVEGDRGVDMGVISSVGKMEPAPASEELGAPDRNAPLRVLHQATAADVTEYELLPQAEEEALEHCRCCLEMVQLSVPITIERAIFQFDRKKLTLQYISEAYVDFNALTRILHNHYKCRIWMHQINRVAAAGSPSAERRHAHHYDKRRPFRSGADRNSRRKQ